MTDSKGITIRNGNLDESTQALGNDFDRVTLHLNLNSAKKALTLLPEEAVRIVLAKAKSTVAKSFPQLLMNMSSDADDDDDDKEMYVDFPTAISIPAWACNHYAIEALMDACNGSAVLYNRSVAALAGALLPKYAVSKEGKTGLQVTTLWSVITDKLKAYEEKKQTAQNRKEPLPNAFYMPLVIMAGMTEDGLELTAIQIKNPNPSFGAGDCDCPFGEFKVVSTVSIQHSNPVSMVSNLLVELSDIVDEVLPELEEDGGVATVVMYGTIAKQLQLKDAMLKTLNGIKGDDVWNTKMDFLSTHEELLPLVHLFWLLFRTTGLTSTQLMVERVRELVSWYRMMPLVQLL